MTTLLPPLLSPALLSPFQGALIGLLWGCELTDRSGIAYHLDQSVTTAIAPWASPGSPLTLAPTLPLVEALAVSLPWALLSFNHGPHGAAFGAIVANHVDRDVLHLWRAMLHRGLAGEPPMNLSFVPPPRGPASGDASPLPISRGLAQALEALETLQAYRQPLGQILDRIQSQSDLTVAERSLVQAIGLGRGLQGQFSLLDRYSQGCPIERPTRPLLLSLVGLHATASRLAPRLASIDGLGPLWLDAYRWGESLVMDWAGVRPTPGLTRRLGQSPP